MSAYLNIFVSSGLKPTFIGYKHHQSLMTSNNTSNATQAISSTQSRNSNQRQRINGYQNTFIASPIPTRDVQMAKDYAMILKQASDAKIFPFHQILKHVLSSFIHYFMIT